MEIDARSLATGELQVDLCIVGGGPAGISVAHEFIGSNLSVVVLESGGHGFEPGLQELNEGSVEGDPYAGPKATRHRQLGGAANIWNTRVGRTMGGKYAPLDAPDLEQSDPALRWPLAYTELVPFYQRAHRLLGLGPFAFEASDWAADLGAAPMLDRHLINRVYQIGPRTPFTRTYLRALGECGNIAVYHHAHARGFRTDNQRRVVAVEAVTAAGSPFQVGARAVVLAAGAIENARLLLIGADKLGLGENRKWIGRCFMEHPRDRSLVLIPRAAVASDLWRYYGRKRSTTGVIVGGRIAVAREAVEAGFANASISLLPGHEPGRPSAIGRLLEPLMGRRVPSTFRVVVNLEQSPDPENRVVLAPERDRLGLHRVQLHWRWREKDQAALERLRTGLIAWLSAWGKVEEHRDVPLDPNAHHHSGTTRMHADPAMGVVDATGRVDRTENLYLAGASVFPAAGWANPTLTVVALGIRLADRLKQIL
jgi:choline dehydrogenase-like flavoprotein